MTSKTIAIVGGGPAGAALGTLCARNGHTVTIFESDPTPRPSVGESLLPYGHRVWDKLGLDLGDTTRKCGAVFYRSGQIERIDFSEAQACPYHAAYQVDRRVLDPRLRDLAQRAGARFVYENQRTVPAGYDWVVDATGRRRSLGRNWTRYSRHTILRNIAFGSHFEGARLPEGCEPGDIAIVGEDGMWFWIIPLTPALMSIGVVLTENVRHLSLEEAIERSSVVRGAISGANMIGKPRGFSDFTESAETFSGAGDFCNEGWALVGDAAFFLDPVFSSGVLFALESADRLCDVICGLKSGADYQREMMAGAKLMENLVLGFYSGHFLELAFSPRSYQSGDIRSGLVGLLAGNLFESSSKAERMVARRLAGLADLVSTRIPTEFQIKAPIIARDARFDEAFARNSSLIPV